MASTSPLVPLMKQCRYGILTIPKPLIILPYQHFPLKGPTYIGDNNCDEKGSSMAFGWLLKYNLLIGLFLPSINKLYF